MNPWIGSLIGYPRHTRGLFLNTWVDQLFFATCPAPWWKLSFTFTGLSTGLGSYLPRSFTASL